LPGRSKASIQFQSVVSPLPDLQAGCPSLLNRYIRSYPPYLGDISSINNPRTRHAVVIGAHITWTKSTEEK